MENEILKPEQQETVEQVETIQRPKMYSQDEVNDIVGKRLARQETKIRKEYDRKYGDLEGVLKAGTGKESVEEMTDAFAEFYKSKGIELPQKPSYSEQDIEVLAGADADEIIRSGYDEVVEEVDRLAAIGPKNMTAREKAAFKRLAEYRQNEERSLELRKLGVTEDVYNSQEFKDFAGKFASATTIREIYDIYNQTKPKKEIKTIGSMKSIDAGNTGVKDFYSYDEAVKFTKADYDRNPELYKRVQESMTKW